MIVPGQTPEGDWPLVKVLRFAGPAPTLSASDVSTARFDNSATFASPEQLKHGTVDFRSEIFSLGCTLWFLLTRTAPFVAPDDPVEVTPGKMGLAIERLVGVPRKVRRLLAHMLAANPDERPPDFIVLEERIRLRLSEVEQRQTIVPPPVEEGVIALPARRRFPVRALALAAVLLALATLVVVALPERFRPGRLLRAARQPARIGVPIGIPEAEAKAAMTLGEKKAQPPASRGEASAKIAATTPPAVASADQISAASAPESSLNPSVSAPPAQQPVPLVASKSPEVAEHISPQPPAEGRGAEASVTSEISPSITSASENVATPVPARLPDPPASGSLEGESSNGKVAAKSQTKTRSVARSSKVAGRNAGRHRSHFANARVRRQGAMVRFRGGMITARVVGTTPEGDLVLALPSHRVVIVPPPAPDF